MAAPIPIGAGENEWGHVGTGAQDRADAFEMEEAFAGGPSPHRRGGPVDPAALKPTMGTLCSRQPEMIGWYSPGDCAYGFGHALMHLMDYNVPRALELCAAFDDLRLYLGG